MGTMSFDAKSPTKVERDGNRYQARYYDRNMMLWFDLGDPRDTEAEARELIEIFRSGKTEEH